MQLPYITKLKVIRQVSLQNSFSQDSLRIRKNKLQIWNQYRCCQIPEKKNFLPPKIGGGGEVPISDFLNGHISVIIWNFEKLIADLEPGGNLL